MVEIINTDTKKFNNPSPFKGTPDEIIPAYNGLIAYYGHIRFGGLESSHTYY